jgi:hypothetical protein
MFKYFHELTKKEYKELTVRKLTYGDLAQDYPQPLTLTEVVDTQPALPDQRGCHMVCGEAECLQKRKSEKL